MKFDLVDQVIELTPERAVTLKNVSAAEEYLQDHFPGFPVLPGVMMIEAMVQAARRVVEARIAPGTRYVLGSVRALKYGAFVRPGESLRVEVALHGSTGPGVFEFKGSGAVLRAGDPAGDDGPPVAVSGRFTMRPVRLRSPG